MDKVVVAGGGIAGLVSSILLAETVDEVYLIEREDSCGGLLRSFQNEDGVYFDQGTHILSETLIQDLDAILFDQMEEKGWEVFDVLKPGNFFQGKMYDKNQMLYAPYLPEDIYSKGLIELLQTAPFQNPVSNLKEYTEKQYGKTFSEHIYAPLMKKLLGCTLEELHQSAHLVFGYSRLIVANEHASRELKKSEFYESKLSFNSFYEGVSSNKKYYPRDRRGVGKWIEQLEETAVKKGVKILTGVSVAKINASDSKVDGVILNNGLSLACDYLVWTLPPFILLKAAEIEFTSSTPRFRDMTLHHFVFDKPFNSSNHYIYCNDANYASFRVTLYPNITNNTEVTAPFNCTVEVLSDPVEDVQKLNSHIHEELIKMGIVETSAKVICSNVQYIERGFPLVTTELVQHSNNQKEIVRENFKNVSLLGKGSFGSFTMHEVLTELYHEIKSLTAQNIKDDMVKVGS